jgi:hypothetical protein
VEQVLPTDRRPRGRLRDGQHLSGGAGPALVQEFGPGHNLRVLLEQGAALPFGHAAPDAEFDLVVESVRRAFLHHRAVATNRRGLALRGPSHKELIWIGGPAQSL